MVKVFVESSETPTLALPRSNRGGEKWERVS